MKKGIIFLILMLFIFTLAVSATAQGSDTYSSFSRLEARQKEGIDYRITSYNGPSSTLVMAIHGGGIESGTGELAAAVADILECDLYTFEGLKSRNNYILHITSTNFDEPTARRLVSKSEKTLSLHGCYASSAVTYIGGRDTKLGQVIEKHLQAAGFKVCQAPDRLDGKHPDNICNLNLQQKGVQLELSRPLRDKFFSPSGLTSTFYRYAEALANALQG